ncbi:MAG TPA: hypothetical protein VKA46_08630 [Gemmataceae bacterium]|nr:hypothetical protein [Gemmataceae bacterium]
MAEKKDAILFKVGDRVKIRYYRGGPGRIVELRGPLAPGGKMVYRVLVRRKPRPVYNELTDEFLELIPADS